MDELVWDKIQNFDFDAPMSEYSFSIRLASENVWTQNFTKKALLEYKKFMYLAAISPVMVSPSAIVDIVWHQHLIFSESYQNFCKLLGKTIQHIPSTHNRADFKKFQEAKEQTKQLYETHFGNQPKDIWENETMFDSLVLEKSKITLGKFTKTAIILLILAIYPLYHVLKPIYVQIPNPLFLKCFILICILTFILFEILNKKILEKNVGALDKNSFIFSLTPFELEFLKNQKNANNINGILNDLLEKKIILINTNKKIEYLETDIDLNQEQFIAVELLKSQGNISVYNILLKQLCQKPFFVNIQNSMNHFKEYVCNSKKFALQFYLNFLVLNILFIVGFLRMLTGFMRNKPITEIAFICIVLAISILWFLNRLTELVCIKTIPNLYTKDVIPNLNSENTEDWRYYLGGQIILASQLKSIINQSSSTSSDSGDEGGSSDSSDSGGGSSCGSSCGGCGGD